MPGFMPVILADLTKVVDGRDDSCAKTALRALCPAVTNLTP
jgi:hypothetical protein